MNNVVLLGMCIIHTSRSSKDWCVAAEITRRQLRTQEEARCEVAGRPRTNSEALYSKRVTPVPSGNSLTLVFHKILRSSAICFPSIQQMEAGLLQTGTMINLNNSAYGESDSKARERTTPQCVSRGFDLSQAWS